MMTSTSGESTYPNEWIECVLRKKSAINAIQLLNGNSLAGLTFIV
jgi:hypothetical protein